MGVTPTSFRGAMTGKVGGAQRPTANFFYKSLKVQDEQEKVHKSGSQTIPILRSRFHVYHLCLLDFHASPEWFRALRVPIGPAETEAE